MTGKPSVLFVCVHNAGRSQMAAGFLEELGAGRVDVLSAGSAPKNEINPVAVAAMAAMSLPALGSLHGAHDPNRFSYFFTHIWRGVELDHC